MSKRAITVRISEVKFQLNEKRDEAAMIKKAGKKIGVKDADISKISIVRESIDARKGITFSYVLDVQLKKPPSKSVPLAPKAFEGLERRLSQTEKAHIKKWRSCERPVVIGFGPAGIFAALQLARAGLKPLVLEQGQAMDQRIQSVDAFWEKGVLNPSSNVQFGEGGAGAFSDGKLTTRIKDRRIELVLDVFIAAGAPEEIRYKNKPHIGTDLLRGVVKNIRAEIEALGGEIQFDSEVVGIVRDETGDALCGLQLKSGEIVKTRHAIAAIGHSARAFYEVLKQEQVALEAKPFAVGVRIEHPQEIINAAQYGKAYVNEALGSAEYKLTYKSRDGRGVYSFCMCPGGLVVASASEQNRLVVNGMSYHARDLYNANSALLVTVTPEDFSSKDPLAGIEFQRMLERAAFEIGGSNYHAPFERVGTFCGQRSSLEASLFYEEMGVDYEAAFNALKPTYCPAIHESSLEKIFPEFITKALREAISHFGHQIPGFDDPRAILTAVESRSSAPVRILRRDDSGESTTLSGFYPCGEGAGYAGGITSSAVDGIKVAEHIIEKAIHEDK